MERWNLDLLLHNRNICLHHNKWNWQICYISSPSYAVDNLANTHIKRSTWKFSPMPNLYANGLCSCLCSPIQFLKELTHLFQIGLLEMIGPSDWRALTFIIPKKDSTIHWVSNFRGLNKLISACRHEQSGKNHNCTFLATLNSGGTLNITLVPVKSVRKANYQAKAMANWQLDKLN